MIEVEVGAAASDAEIHLVRNAALTAADQYTRKQVDTQFEYLGDCKFIPTTKIPRTWGMPIDTSIEGVRIWGVTMVGLWLGLATRIDVPEGFWILTTL